MEVWRGGLLSRRQDLPAHVRLYQLTVVTNCSESMWVRRTASGRSSRAKKTGTLTVSRRGSRGGYLFYLCGVMSPNAVVRTFLVDKLMSC